MAVSKKTDGTTWWLSFAHPRELGDYRPGLGANKVRLLHLIEEVVTEVPSDRKGREVSLQSLLSHFPGLQELIIEAHIFVPELAHENVVRASLSGGRAFPANHATTGRPSTRDFWR